MRIFGGGLYLLLPDKSISPVQAWLLKLSAKLNLPVYLLLDAVFFVGVLIGLPVEVLGDALGGDEDRNEDDLADFEDDEVVELTIISSFSSS